MSFCAFLWLKSINAALQIRKKDASATKLPEKTKACLLSKEALNELPTETMLTNGVTVRYINCTSADQTD